MKQIIIDILNEDIKDLETVDFGFNHLFLNHYCELRNRIKNADNDVIEELKYDMNLFEKFHHRKKNRSAYYGKKLSLYMMDLDKFVS